MTQVTVAGTRSGQAGRQTGQHSRVGTREMVADGAGDRGWFAAPVGCAGCRSLLPLALADPERGWPRSRPIQLPTMAVVPAKAEANRRPGRATHGQRACTNKRVGRRWHGRWHGRYQAEEAHRGARPRSAWGCHRTWLGSRRMAARCWVRCSIRSYPPAIRLWWAPADCATTAGSIQGQLGWTGFVQDWPSRQPARAWKLLAVAEIFKSHLARSQRARLSGGQGWDRLLPRRCGVCVSRDATTPRARDDADGLGWSVAGCVLADVAGLSSSRRRVQTQPQRRRGVRRGPISNRHAVAPAHEAAAAHRLLQPAKLTAGAPLLCSLSLAVAPLAPTPAIARLRLLLLNERRQSA
jgi:hypothetical protein